MASDLPMEEDRIIKEFCSSESHTIHDRSRKRRSILIQIARDLDYNLGVNKAFREMNLSDKQQSMLDTELAPLLVPPLLLSSAIDSMARVLNLGRRPSNNRRAFVHSAKTLFGLGNTEAEMMWSMRNSLSHSYSLRGFSFVRYERGGFGEGIQHVIATRPMRAMLQGAMISLERHLLALSPEDKQVACRYIEEHGFLYYMADDNANTEKSAE